MHLEKVNNFRKFKNADFFKSPNSNYYLLPFRFHRINEEKEVLVNEVGDFLVVPIGTAYRITNKKIEINETLYADLIANFFISEKPIPELIDILATRYRTKKSFISDFTGLHIFVITLRCEHTCNYCQVSRVTHDKDKYDMTIETLDRGIELMMCSPNPHVTMEFQGGEALLAFDRIKYAVEKAKKLANEKSKGITFVICTNLALINHEILQFCKKYDVLISTSLDGPKYIHDANRQKLNTSSYELTIKGIELTRQILGRDKVSALMTTTQLSLEHPYEIVDEYFNRGFTGIFLRSISPYGFALRTEKNRYGSKAFLEFYKKALERIIEYNLQGYYFEENFTKIILTKMLTPFNDGFVDLQSPAGVITGVIVFNYDGGVYASDESRMLAEQNDFTFKLGTVNNSYKEIFFGEKALVIAEVSINESITGCSDCAFQTYCGADPVHNWAAQGDLYGYRPTSDFCIKNMEIFRYLIELIDNKDVLPIFHSWITYKH